MGFCTAKHIDLLNMTNGRRSAARRRRKSDALAAGDSAVKRAPFRAADGPLSYPRRGGEQVAFVAYGLNTVGLRGVVEQFFAQAEIATSTLRSIPS
jgi:hypothetical protein